MAKAKGAHYVNNKDFLHAMIAWRETVDEAVDSGETPPPVTNYIGECFLKIATHLSYKPNFINYTYREEMICDGIENCLQYIKNFNPEKSNNPFAYFTQIIYYAFLRRINKEKKQSHVKNKMLEKQEVVTHTVMEHDTRSYNVGNIDLANFLPLEDVYKPKQKTNNKKKNLENFMEPEIETSDNK
jgi:hypothetical protein